MAELNNYWDERENLLGGHKAKVAAKKAGATKKEAKTAAKDKRKETTKKIVKSAEKVLVNSGEAVAFAPLVPFVPMMKNRLKADGISHDGTILGIAKKFAGEIVAKKSNFENFYNADTAAGDIIKGAATAALTGNPAGLVTAIIGWIKGLVGKKKLSVADAKSKKDAEESASKLKMFQQKPKKEGWFAILLRALGLKKKLPAKTETFENFYKVESSFENFHSKNIYKKNREFLESLVKKHFEEC